MRMTFQQQQTRFKMKNFSAREEKFAIIFYNTSRLFSTFIAEAILNNRACLIIAFL